MAGNTIQEWLISLGFQVDKQSLAGLNKGVEAAKKNLDGASKSAASLGGNLSGALGAASPAVARATSQVKTFSDALKEVAKSPAMQGLAAVGGFVAIGAGSIAAAKNFAFETVALARLADQFRLTTDALDDYLDLAEVMDIPQEDATESLRSLDRAITDTALGVGRAKIIFEKLGIEVKNADGSLKSTIDVMDELRAQFKGMERAQAIGIMERLGVDPKMIRLFEKDATSIQKRFAEIDAAAGFSMASAEKSSKQFVANWRGAREEINLFLKIFKVQFEVFKLKIMNVIGPFLKPFTAQLEKLSKIVQGIDFFGFFGDLLSVISAGLMLAVTGLMTLFTKFLEVLRTTKKYVMQAFQPMIDYIKTLTPEVKAFITALGVVAAILVVINALNPLARLIAAFVFVGTLIGLLIEDFEVWQEGGDSLFGDGWMTWIGIVDMFTASIDILINSFKALWNIARVVGGVLQYAFTFDSSALESVKSDIASVKSNFQGIAAGGDKLNKGINAVTGSTYIGAGSPQGAPMVNAPTTLNVQITGATAADGKKIAGDISAAQVNNTNAVMRNVRAPAR